MKEREVSTEAVQDRTDARELFCKDFDLSCFDVPDAAGCKRGKQAVINGLTYFTIPVVQICPLSDHIIG